MPVEREGLTVRLFVRSKTLVREEAEYRAQIGQLIGFIVTKLSVGLGVDYRSLSVLSETPPDVIDDVTVFPVRIF